MKTFCAATLGLGFLIAAQGAQAETYNLRNSCERWEFIPANEALSSPAAALLTCTNKETDAAWLSLQVLCFTEPTVLEIRYQTGYEAMPIAPVIEVPEAEVIATDDTVSEQDLGAEADAPEVLETPPPPPVYEIVSFLTSSGGYHHAGLQDQTTGAWHVNVNTIHYPLLLAMARANYIEVALGPIFDKERLPLRGSSKALAQVKQACRALDGS